MYTQVIARAGIVVEANGDYNTGKEYKYRNAEYEYENGEKPKTVPSTEDGLSFFTGVSAAMIRCKNTPKHAKLSRRQGSS